VGKGLGSIEKGGIEMIKILAKEKLTFKCRQ